MNRQQAFEFLSTIAAVCGCSISNRIRPDSDWHVTPLSNFRTVKGESEALIYLGPHRVAAVIGQGPDNVKLAEKVVIKANQHKTEVSCANQ